MLGALDAVRAAGFRGAAAADVVRARFFGRFYEKATAWLYAYDPGTLTGTGSGAGVAT